MLSGRADFSIEQAWQVVGMAFGEPTDYMYHQTYAYIEAAPKLRPRYLNMVYPLDMQTWITAIVALVLVIAVSTLAIVGPSNNQNVTFRKNNLLL